MPATYLNAQIYFSFDVTRLAVGTHLRDRFDRGSAHKKEIDNDMNEI